MVHQKHFKTNETVWDENDQNMWRLIQTDNKHESEVIVGFSVCVGIVQIDLM